MSAPIRQRATRRELLAGCAAAAAAGVLLEAPPAAAAAQSDAQLLVPLVGTEMLAVFAYRRAIDSGLLPPAGQRLAATVLAQEHAHERAIRAELLRLGGRPPKPLVKLTDADKVLAANRIPGSLGNLHDEHDTIIVLAEVEFLLEDAYRHAISKLSDGRLVGLCAKTLAAEAQHGVGLSELLHPGDVKKAVPSPYV